MTAACGGGSSTVKPGTEAVVLVTSGRIAQVLETSGVPELVALVPFLTLPPFVTSVFCAADPPSMTALTSAESDALLNLKFGTDFTNGLGKVVSYATNAVWNDICECSSGSTPTGITPPASPSNTPIPLGPAASPTQACANYVHIGTYAGSPQCNSWGPSSSSAAYFTIPTVPPAAPNTAVTVTGTITQSPGPTPGQAVTCTWTKTGSANVNQSASIANGATSVNLSFSSPGDGFIFSNIAFSSNGTGGVVQLCLVCSLWCNGDIPNSTQSPCCPPDSATQSYLDAIFKAVTLIQRQVSPFAYNLSTVHSGLSGSGDFPVQGLIGIKLAPGTPPAYSGKTVGDPDQLWLESWFNWGNGDGWSERIWLTHSPQISMPSVAGQWTRIGYTFAPGLTVDITELVREP